MAPPVSRSRRPPSRRRRPRWLAVVFLLLLVVPILEIAAIIAVGRVIGGWQTLRPAGAGVAARRLDGQARGRARLGRAQEALRTGRMPSRQLADAALVLIGGTLLLTPGFVTDIVGFFFILPLTRPIARRAGSRPWSPGGCSGA